MKEMYHKYPSLMEQVVRRQNIDYAVQAVKRNKGAAGIDNMTVNEIEAHIDKYFVPCTAVIGGKRFGVIGMQQGGGDEKILMHKKHYMDQEVE